MHLPRVLMVALAAFTLAFAIRICADTPAFGAANCCCVDYIVHPAPPHGQCDSPCSELPPTCSGQVRTAGYTNARCRSEQGKTCNLQNFVAQLPNFKCQPVTCQGGGFACGWFPLDTTTSVPMQECAPGSSECHTPTSETCGP